MTLTVRIFSVLAGLVLFGLVSFFVRRRRIYNLYAITWFAFCLFFVIAGLFSHLVIDIANVLGIYYPPSAIFLVGMVALLTIILHLSMIVTQQHKDLRRLEKEQALLRVMLPFTSNK